MTKEQILLWTPRILAILYIGFISMFALDSLSDPLGFFMHMIPSFILIGILILAWKKPKVGGYTFGTLAILFGLFFNGFEDIYAFLIIVLPLLLVGILFFISYKHK